MTSMNFIARIIIAPIPSAASAAFNAFVANVASFVTTACVSVTTADCFNFAILPSNPLSNNA